MWQKFKKLLSGITGTPNDPSPGVRPTPPSEAQVAGPAREDILRRAYAELDLPPGTDLNTVRRAWKAALKQVHPDHYADNPETKRRAQERTRRLNEAYQILRDALF